jgi:hypothetical protein
VHSRLSAGAKDQSYPPGALAAVIRIACANLAPAKGTSAEATPG